MDRSLFESVKKIDVGVTSQPVKDWKDRYSKVNKPNTFCIEETNLGPKILYRNTSGQTFVTWPRKIDDGIIGVPSRAWIREAVIEYFADPKAFMMKVAECDVPGTMHPQETPDVDAEKNAMEDYSETEDPSKLKDKTKENGELKTREVKDKELEQKPPETRESKRFSVQKPHSHRIREIFGLSGRNYFIPIPVDVRRDEVSNIRAAVQKAVNSGFIKSARETNSGFSLNGVKDPTKVNQLLPRGVTIMRESKVNENEKKPRQKLHGYRIRESLRFCNDCNKTFRSNDVGCKCGSNKTELLGEREYSDMVSDGDKLVFKVEYVQDGQKKEDRVTAFDEADAKRYVEKMKRGAKATGAKKISSESKIREEHKDILSGGLADDKPEKEFDPEQIKMGIKVEMEHTDTEELAKEIAMDHLAEDPEYYTKLAKMEAGGCDESNRVNEGVYWRDLGWGNVDVPDLKGWSIKNKKDGKVFSIDRVGSKGVSAGDTHVSLDDHNDWVLIDPNGKAVQFAKKSGKNTEGKVPDDTDPEDTKIRKLTEGVTELINLMDEISEDDKRVVRDAIKNGVMEDDWPSEEQMIDELSQQEDFVDPGNLDTDLNIRMAWLKYVAPVKALATVGESKVKEANLNEPAGFESCVERGGRVRTVAGPDKEHGLKANEHVKYCYIGGKSFRGEVKTKKSESKVNEATRKPMGPAIFDYYPDDTSGMDRNLADAIEKAFGGYVYEDSTGAYYEEMDSIPFVLSSKPLTEQQVKDFIKSEIDRINKEADNEAENESKVAEQGPVSAPGQMPPIPNRPAPGQKPESPEEKKKREALVTAAAKAVEAFGEDELEAYAEQIKKRQQKVSEDKETATKAHGANVSRRKRSEEELAKLTPEEREELSEFFGKWVKWLQTRGQRYLQSELHGDDLPPER